MHIKCKLSCLQTIPESKLQGENVKEFENTDMRIKQELFTPSLQYNLVSSGILTDNGTAYRFR